MKLYAWIFAGLLSVSAMPSVSSADQLCICLYYPHCSRALGETLFNWCVYFSKGETAAAISIPNEEHCGGLEKFWSNFPDLTAEMRVRLENGQGEVLCKNFFEF